MIVCQLKLYLKSFCKIHASAMMPEKQGPAAPGASVFGDITNPCGNFTSELGKK
jgi:hypothetical protein